MAFTTVGEKLLIDCFTGVVSDRPQEYWVGLCSDINGTEIAAGDTYARVSCTDGGGVGPAFGAATGAAPTCEAVNSDEIAFTESGAAWNSGNAIIYAGLFDAVSGGNLLAVITLTLPGVTVSVAGQTVKFAAGALTISVL